MGLVEEGHSQSLKSGIDQKNTRTSSKSKEQLSDRGSIS